MSPGSPVGSQSGKKTNAKKKVKVPEELEEVDLFQILRKKAEQEDLEKLVETKTNKIDSEKQLKAIDILHK